MALCGKSAGDLHRPPANVDSVARNLHVAGKTSVHAVEAEQMRIGLHRSQVVDRHHFDICPAGFDDGAQHVAADAAKAIDCDTYGHLRAPLGFRRNGSCKWRFRPGS